MRNDYFTISELRKLLHTCPSTLCKRAGQPGYFPAARVGSGQKTQFIIDKAQFYEWYFKAYNLGKLRELFPHARMNHDQILQSYQEYMEFKHQNNEALRRQFVKNKRPVYRRKGSYYGIE